MLLCQVCTTFLGNAIQIRLPSHGYCRRALGSCVWASSHVPCVTSSKSPSVFLLQPFVLSAQTKHAGWERNGRMIGAQHSSPTCRSTLFPHPHLILISSSSSLPLNLSPRSTAQHAVLRTGSTKCSIWAFPPVYAAWWQSLVFPAYECCSSSAWNAISLLHLQGPLSGTCNPQPSPSRSDGHTRTYIRTYLYE